jgi:hypothetical protein
MQVRGAIATRTFGAEPDIAAWANGCALNPARIDPLQREDPAVQAAAARLADHLDGGLTRMAELVNEPLPTQRQFPLD